MGLLDQLKGEITRVVTEQQLATLVYDVRRTAYQDGYEAGFAEGFRTDEPPVEQPAGTVDHSTGDATGAWIVTGLDIDPVKVCYNPVICAWCTERGICWGQSPEGAHYQRIKDYPDWDSTTRMTRQFICTCDSGKNTLCYIHDAPRRIL